jgi:hypothetical protein
MVRDRRERRCVRTVRHPRNRHDGGPMLEYRSRANKGLLSADGKMVMESAQKQFIDMGEGDSFN